MTNTKGFYRIKHKLAADTDIHPDKVTAVDGLHTR